MTNDSDEINETTVTTSVRGPDDTEAVRRIRPSVGIFLLVGFIAFFLPLAVVIGKQLLKVTLERTPPRIIVNDQPRGIGVTPVRLSVHIDDNGSGLSQAAAELFQGNQRISLFSQAYDKEKSADLDIPLDSAELPIRAGPASIVISARDASKFKNEQRITIPLLVDRKRPEIKLLLPALNRRVGEAELCFVRIQDENFLKATTRDDFAVHEIYPARFLDPSFEDRTLFVTWIPRSNAQGGRVTAEDEVGNIGQVDCGAELLSPVWRQADLPPSKTIEGSNDEKESAYAKLYAEHEKIIRAQIEIGSKQERIWSDFFEAPLNTSTEYGYDTWFGESKRTPLQGILYKPSDFTVNVQSPGAGLVTWIGETPWIGKTILIDHGLGLWSVIGGFSTINVKLGDKVRKSQNLGLSGSLPISEKNSVFFQMRIHNSPINPQYLLDNSWYLVNVSRRIGAAKRALGIEITNPSER